MRKRIVDTEKEKLLEQHKLNHLRKSDLHVINFIIVEYNFTECFTFTVFLTF